MTLNFIGAIYTNIITISVNTNTVTITITNNTISDFHLPLRI